MARPQVRHSATIRKDYRSRRQLVGDSGRHAQVFLNLVVNAAQAMPKRALAENVITVTTRDEGPSVVIEIADNGVGIPPGDLPHVFDPFFTTKSAGEGMGLGLAISKSIVESQGGTLGVESAPQRGSLFRVVLPAAHRVGNRLEASAPTRARARRWWWMTRSPRLGDSRCSPEHEVLTYTDPLFEAEVGALNDADVVLCDVMMQGMTGPRLPDASLPLATQSKPSPGRLDRRRHHRSHRRRRRRHGASVLGPFGARELRAAVALVLDAPGRKHAA
ncbi:MAG: ATP-binding protein [Polyangiaceae bacterium]